MTIALVGSAGALATGENSVDPSFGQSTTAGNLLVAWVQSNNSDTSNPLEISGSGWTLINSAGRAYNWMAVYYKADCGSGETAPTFSNSDANGSVMFAGLSEYSGAATSSPLDQHGAVTDGDPCYATAVDTAASDLIVGLSGWDGANSGAAPGQQFYGSGGGQLLLVNNIQTNWTGQQPAGLLNLFSYVINASTLGPDANEVHALVDEYEGYVSSIIASFKHA